MDIWLITVGEPLPVEGPDIRLYRTGLLAKVLVSRGHRITWWTSSFNHNKKIFFKYDSNPWQWVPGLDINFMGAVGYKKNISLRRMLDHWYIGKSFRKLAKKANKPDLIICSYPTIELSMEAVIYGEKHNVPVVIDIRDLWPDIITDIFPKTAEKIIRLLLFPLFMNAGYVFRNCKYLTAVSDRYLEWGIKYSERKKSTQDGVFPLGYPDIQKIPDAEIDKYTHNNKIDRNRMVCVFIGTFGSTYDLPTVIGAIKKLPDTKLEKLEFIFCGDGENMDNWKNLAANMPQIKFTGWVNSVTIQIILNIADIGIAAYREGAPQGIPNKIIEYLSAGLPLLSSLTGETSELIAKYQLGYTYNAKEPDDFNRGLDYLLDENRRKVYSDNCITLFNREYKAENIYNNFAKYLEEINKNK